MGGFVRPYTFIDNQQTELAPLLDYNTLHIGTSTERYFKKIKAFKDTPIRESFKDAGDSLFQDYSRLLYVPGDYLDTAGVEYFTFYFSGCRSLIKAPEMDTSSGTTFRAMFNGCTQLRYLPELNTSNGTNFGSMFSSCEFLEHIPSLDLRKSTGCIGMFSFCYRLKVIEGLIFSTITTTNLNGAFTNNYSLETIQIEGKIKVDSNHLNLSNSPNLTVNSLMSFINAFEDNSGEEIQYTVTIGTTNLAKLTPEQVAVATSKNILLA